jgi:hypothetical protein
MLAPALATMRAEELKVVETEKTIAIARGEIPVLTYHKAEVDPPAGADPVFKRSGFIHPLCAPSGEPVTGIHPSDHYHHLGLWHAWVKTKHGKDEPDFWNLKTGTGRVRYAKTAALLQSSAEDPAAGFVVEQEHVAYKGAGKTETVVLRERLEVKAEFEDGANVVSYTVEQENVSAESLELPAYRYGGCLAYRAPHDWDQSNSDYLTSEGLDRTNSHESRAKWVAMHGPTAKGEATLTVLIHPDNHDFPQRLRTWPADTNNGAIFFNVVPAQEKPWEIKAGEKIVMAYLLVVSDGKPEKEKIEGWWKEYGGEK